MSDQRDRRLDAAGRPARVPPARPVPDPRTQATPDPRRAAPVRLPAPVRPPGQGAPPPRPGPGRPPARSAGRAAAAPRHRTVRPGGPARRRPAAARSAPRTVRATCRCSPTTRPAPPRWPGRARWRWPSDRRAARPGGGRPGGPTGEPARALDLAPGALRRSTSLLGAGGARPGARVRRSAGWSSGADRRRRRDHPGGHVHLRRRRRRWPPCARRTSTGSRSPWTRCPSTSRGGAGRRGPHLLLQPRLRHHRHRARRLQPAHRRRRRRLDDHPAVRQGLHRRGDPTLGASTRRSCSRSRSPRSGQGPDPRELPEHIYFGRGAYGIQAAAQAYFGKDVERPHGVRGRDAGRHDPGAVELGPGQEPEPVAAPLDLRAGPDGRAEVARPGRAGRSRRSRTTGSRSPPKLGGMPDDDRVPHLQQGPGRAGGAAASPRTRSTPRA